MPIEIIDRPDAENSGNQFLSMGYKTDDVVKMRETLMKKGYEVSEMISPMPQIRFFFAKDPAGVTIQFM